MSSLLITGGLGYIGSHAVVAFAQAGYEIVIIDNLSNTDIWALDGLESILGYRPMWYQGDVGDRVLLKKIFETHRIDGVVHFAGYKAVGESCADPFGYYDNNITQSIELFRCMERYGVRKIVFSSSATVYQAGSPCPITESTPLGTTNPYGTTKLVLEHILRDLGAHAEWQVSALRYFNPIGAHPSGHIGEIPRGTPNNLLPYVYDVALGRRETVRIFGDDYPTPDGTGVRDYIDVCDLAEAHIAAYTHLHTGYAAINIGTGRGVSVRELLASVEKTIGAPIPHTVVERRPGDVAVCYADASLAEKILGWKAQTPLLTSLQYGWDFIRKHYEQK